MVRIQRAQRVAEAEAGRIVAMGRKPGQHVDTRQKMYLCYHLTMEVKNKSPFKPQHKAATKDGRPDGAYLELARKWNKSSASMADSILDLASKGRARLETEEGEQDYYDWRNEREFIWWSLEREKDLCSPKQHGEFSSEHIEAVVRWYDEHPEVPRRILSRSYNLDLTPDEFRVFNPEHVLTAHELERLRSVQRQWARLGFEAALAEAKRRLTIKDDPWMKRDYDAWKSEGTYRSSGPTAWMGTPKSMQATQDAERLDSGLPLKVSPKKKS